ncbi:hypothetical protein M9Y10_022283 [Tritrichomonas musculus]|uniref:Bromo domain-containing protein n=1 Tax=Tritrichomonas musculus TaxID=1915356 RepID=A0ABR2KRZ7_9EUKA
MTKLSDFQLKQCLKILDKLEEKSISKPFQRNLAENFGLPEPIREYLEKPIDLSTIRDRLKNNKYKTIQEWGRDVFLVFDNVLCLFHVGSPINAMAKDLRNWFEKKLKNFPRTRNEKWLIEFNSTHEKLQKLVDSYPKSKSSSISTPSNSYSTPRYTQEEEESYSQKPTHHHNNENNHNHSKNSKSHGLNKISTPDKNEKNEDLEDDLEDDSNQASFHSSNYSSQAVIAEDPRKKEKKKIESIQLFPDLD